jgi:hypothetical protein
MLGHWYTLLLLPDSAGPPATGPREVWRGDSSITTTLSAISAIAIQFSGASSITTQVNLASAIDQETPP